MGFLLFQPESDHWQDPITGLPGAVALMAELTAWSGPAATEEPRGEGDFLLLLEVYPQARNAAGGIKALRRAGDYLQSLFAAATPLYALGMGVFALLWPGVGPENARHMADMLLRRLQREDFPRAQAGLVAIGRGGRQSEAEVLDEAWRALAVARRRGPFGLCVAGSERVFPPLAAADRAKLSRLWRGRDCFALLLIRQDQVALSNHFSKRVRAALEPETPALFLNQREVLVYLDGAGEAEAEEWFQGFRRRMLAAGGSTFSAGIALYPCLNFRKSQIPINCRKAVRHAELLGPESVAVFNAVSLNVSGDAYYNEGDLRKAVGEYRLGLTLQPASVNLLNSLGVALVQLKQVRPALAAFEKALQVEPENFMALCNLGFAHLSADREGMALDFFERALAVEGRSFDLLLQLGKLYCRHRKYREAVELLNRCVDDPRIEERRNGDLAAAHRLLGRALMALEQYRPAMTAVQKALTFNPRDAQAMSLLGELYLHNGQGGEIAHSLCRQAVELDAGRSESWRRLGWVQWQLGLPAEAAASLEHCLHLNRRDHWATAWLGEILAQQGQARRARHLQARARRLAAA
ncbi:tetratricopeptide repeat protein [Desulfurivibrio alkaliphilus]|uniref:Tetratricopeptide TPR_2 repeat protein n=1 Tax=Desulfurivibrio alkaliphilus (strain DSM 19089 / UNIQEM U267 / AHT2) TaxID=589865 RepID=D6Z645_DESAT|nr:tetratricopeptide repeat protein [Desulfurivibrio alkaliphilus]ADH84927.1 Tetratricopeptide TPR_2 repeat protein [Desulfurivibrio alkaliphilus AHT 2]